MAGFRGDGHILLYILYIYIIYNIYYIYMYIYIYNICISKSLLFFRESIQHYYKCVKMSP